MPIFMRQKGKGKGEIVNCKDNNSQMHAFLESSEASNNLILAFGVWEELDCLEEVHPFNLRRIPGMK